jgi:hypothetical protein
LERKQSKRLFPLHRRASGRGFTIDNYFQAKETMKVKSELLEVEIAAAAKAYRVIGDSANADVIFWEVIESRRADKKHCRPIDVGRFITDVVNESGLAAYIEIRQAIVEQSGAVDPQG